MFTNNSFLSGLETSQKLQDGWSVKMAPANLEAFGIDAEKIFGRSDISANHSLSVCEFYNDNEKGETPQNISLYTADNEKVATLYFRDKDFTVPADFVAASSQLEKVTIARDDMSKISTDIEKSFKNTVFNNSITRNDVFEVKSALVVASELYSNYKDDLSSEQRCRVESVVMDDTSRVIKITSGLKMFEKIPLFLSEGAVIKDYVKSCIELKAELKDIFNDRFATDEKLENREYLEISDVERTSQSGEKIVEHNVLTNQYGFGIDKMVHNSNLWIETVKEAQNETLISGQSVDNDELKKDCSDKGFNIECIDNARMSYTSEILDSVKDSRVLNRFADDFKQIIDVNPELLVKVKPVLDYIESIKVNDKLSDEDKQERLVDAMADLSVIIENSGIERDTEDVDKDINKDIDKDDTSDRTDNPDRDTDNTQNDEDKDSDYYDKPDIKSEDKSSSDNRHDKVDANNTESVDNHNDKLSSKWENRLERYQQNMESHKRFPNPYRNTFLAAEKFSITVGMYADSKQDNLTINDKSVNVTFFDVMTSFLQLQSSNIFDTVFVEIVYSFTDACAEPVEAKISEIEKSDNLTESRTDIPIKEDRPNIEIVKDDYRAAVREYVNEAFDNGISSNSKGPVNDLDSKSSNFKNISIEDKQHIVNSVIKDKLDNIDRFSSILKVDSNIDKTKAILTDIYGEKIPKDIKIESESRYADIVNGFIENNRSDDVTREDNMADDIEIRTSDTDTDSTVDNNENEADKTDTEMENADNITQNTADDVISEKSDSPDINKIEDNQNSVETKSFEAKENNVEASDDNTENKANTSVEKKDDDTDINIQKASDIEKDAEKIDNKIEFDDEAEPEFINDVVNNYGNTDNVEYSNYDDFQGDNTEQKDYEDNGIGYGETDAKEDELKIQEDINDISKNKDDKADEEDIESEKNVEIQKDDYKVRLNELADSAAKPDENMDTIEDTENTNSYDELTIDEKNVIKNEVVSDKLRDIDIDGSAEIQDKIISAVNVVETFYGDDAINVISASDLLDNSGISQELQSGVENEIADRFEENLTEPVLIIDGALKASYTDDAINDSLKDVESQSKFIDSIDTSSVEQLETALTIKDVLIEQGIDSLQADAAVIDIIRSGIDINDIDNVCSALEDTANLNDLDIEAMRAAMDTSVNDLLMQDNEVEIKDNTPDIEKEKDIIDDDTYNLDIDNFDEISQVDTEFDTDNLETEDINNEDYDPVE